MNRHSPRFDFNPKTARRPARISSMVTAMFASCIVQYSHAQQEPPQEIVVTADFREAKLRDFAGSVEVIDAETLERQNARHLEDVLDSLANVNYASGASRARFYQIRGIGERSQYSEPLNSSVGVLIDGVDYSGLGTASTLYDIQQVEVLLGPQGTRYGSNALAGLINLRSAPATEVFTAGVQAGLGNQDTRELAGFVSGPMSDDLLYRLSAQIFESDGYNFNRTVDRPTNFRDEQTLRGRLEWQIDEDASLHLGATLIDIDNGYDAFSLDNTRDTWSDEPGFDRQQTTALNATYARDLGEYVLEVIGSTARAETDYGYDEDWSFTGLHPDEYSSVDRYLRDRDSDSLELRLNSPDEGDFSWVAGIYTLRQDVDLERIYTYLSSPYTSNYGLDRIAVYADTRTRLGERLSLDAGLRLERYDGEFDDSLGVTFAPEDSLAGGRLTLRYQHSADTLFFAGVSRGYKTGGFNTDGSLDPSLREFDAEYLWNYEAGIKTRLTQYDLSLQATFFFMDRDDVQVRSYAAIERNDGSTEFFDYTGNAAAGFNTGVELTAHWQATPQLALDAAVGLLNSEYRDFINSEGEDLDGREQAHAPSWQFSLSAVYDFSDALSGSITLNGKDAFYFSDSHDVQSDSYQTVNTEFTWRQGDWSVRLWARNLFDEDYYVRGFYFGNDPRDGYTAKGYTQFGENRRYGVTLNHEF